MKIEIHGWLTNSKVIDSMRENDVLVFPSHAEGFPNVIVEALSQGMPLITTNVGGILDSAINNKNALIVPIKDSNSLKIAMEKFVIDKSLVEKFSKKSCRMFKINNHQNENCKRFSVYFKIMSNYNSGIKNRIFSLSPKLELILRRIFYRNKFLLEGLAKKTQKSRKVL